jgi:hypothetical protein
VQPHGRDVPDRFRHQARACAALGSPLYAGLLEEAARDVEAGGPLRGLTEPFAGEPGRQALPLRLLAGVHRLVLRGDLPELAAFYPSAGGRRPAAGAWPAFRHACQAPGPELDTLLRRPLQTNEVGRTAALLGGFLLVSRETGLPLRLLELGASAGLQLRWDHYRDAPWLRPLFEVAPPLDGPVAVVERRGCDLAPIDPTTPAGLLTVRSFVWADMTERLRMLDDAVEVCRRVPALVDRADAGDWLPARLAEARPGATTVVFHSVVMQYLADAALARVRSALARAAAAATAEAPLAWLRFEPGEDDPRGMEVRLRLWPGGEDRLLATATPHGRRVRWVAG